MCSHYTTGVLHKTLLAESCILFLSWKMLFPCQHHSWEAWPSQGKALLMILNRFSWVPVMLRQELAPGICFVLTVSDQSCQSWKFSLCMACPLLGFLLSGTGRSVLRLFCLLWVIPLAGRVPPKRLLFETAQNCAYPIFPIPQNVTFLPHVLLPYLAAASLCWSSGQPFPGSSLGCKSQPADMDITHIREWHSPLPLQPCNIDVSLVNLQIKLNFFLLLK